MEMNYAERLMGSDTMCRMHVLKGSDPKNITAPYNDLGQITTPDENYAIDVCHFLLP